EVQRDFAKRVAQGDEVNHVLILVERPGDLRRHAIIVPVQPLADVAGKRNEMRSAERQRLFLDADVIGRGHGNVSQLRARDVWLPCLRGGLTHELKTETAL